MLRESYDLLVIGGGPTGLTAALAAAAGGRTCLIIDGTEKSKVQFSGPTGLFSKALRDAAKKISVRTLREMGLRDATVWKQVYPFSSGRFYSPHWPLLAIDSGGCSCENA